MVSTIEETRASPVPIGARDFASVPRRWTSLARQLPVLPLAILVPFVLMALFADFIAPYDPTEPIPGAKIFEPPYWMQGGSMHALLGTDFQSRDVLSRLIFGARVSLIVGVTGTLVAGSIGTALGILAGYLGRWVDQVIMRLTDAWLALPGLVFAIFLATMVGPSMWNIVIILGLVYWTRYARVIRGEVLSLREREFVKLAEIAGGSRARVIFRHILPNVLNSTMVLASLTIGVVIIAEASLSFLGVGVPPPEPAWGSMLADGRSMLMVGDWWLTIFPGLGILLVVLATQLFGDWLRVRLDLRTHFTTLGGSRVVKAVDGISFTLKEGETLGLIGESGSGKTTTCLSIVGLLPRAARIVGGRVAFEGEDLTKKSQRELRRIRGRRIAVILQDPMASLNPLFTIYRQVAEPAFFHQHLRGRPLRERVQGLLRAVRIPSPEWRMREYPHQMSGGMRQRIVGAIALSGGPRLVIADEPTTNLDVTIQAQYLDLLKDIQRETGVALIFVTHNLGIVAKMCDRVAVMYAGKIVEQAPVRELFDDPKHPYTRALLGSMPKLGHKEPLYSIRGQPPNLADLPTGCAFHPRCPDVMSRCMTEEPPDVHLGGSVARCLLL